MKNNILDVNKLVLALAEYPEAEDDIVGMYVKGDALSGMISQRCSPNYCNLFRKRADESQIPGSRQADPWNYFPYPEGDRISYYHPICGYR